jgi:predicted ATPase
MTPQLLSVELRAADPGEDFPFSVPSIRSLNQLSLDAPVTLLVGENGSGKSTFLEGLAIATKLPTVGSVPAMRDNTLTAQRRLARGLRLSWRDRSHRGFFLRAEDFFGFSKTLAQMKVDFEREKDAMADKFKDHSPMAQTLAQGPALRSLGEMKERYGENPDARSHGEGFLHLFQSRLVPRGLYLLDEPEAALSPQSQLAFLSMLKASIDDGSQFVIATHSPILMAVPDAVILSFDSVPVRSVAFEELEHVSLLRDYLASPERFLRHLWR